MDLPSLTGLAERVATTNIALVVLFGSQARGTAHASSDVDIGVIAADRKPMSLRDLRQTFGMVSDWLGRSVDVADLATPDAIFRYEVVKSAKVLYEREPGLWTEFVAKTLIDYADISRFIPALIAGVARAARADAT